MNRKNQPPVIPLKKFSIAEPDKYYLQNGLPVYVFRDDLLEIVKVEFVFDAGSWFQPKPFVAFASNQMLREGTDKYSSKQIAEKLDYYGSQLETNTEKDKASLTLISLQKHLSSALPIIENIIKQSSYPQKEFKTIAQKQKQVLRVNLEKVRYLSQTRFNELLYGSSHPYGSYLLPENIDEVTPELLRHFRSEHYLSNNCMIIIAGKFPEDDFKLLEQLFGGQDWSVSLSQPQIFSSINGKDRNILITKEGAVQSAIRIGSVMFPRNHPDFMGMQILTTLLGGYFGSRLMANLREDKGYTYGVGSAIIPLRYSGYFFIGCEVGEKDTQAAINEIYKELELLCRKSVPDAELDLVRNYMQGSFLRSFDGSFQRADKYRAIVESGLDNSYYADFSEKISCITPEEIKNLANKYFDPKNLYQLVVGDPASLK